jgi:flagellar basal body rod protein FlgB
VDSTAVSNTKDGNTVQLENELMKLNQNTIAHALETQLITGSTAPPAAGHHRDDPS